MANKEPQVKRGILVTTSYTPPRLSTIEWVEERRAVVIITKQDDVDYTGGEWSEASRRRPKHAIIPWGGDDETLNNWKYMIARAAELHEHYVAYVNGMDVAVEQEHMKYLNKEEWEKIHGKRRSS